MSVCLVEGSYTTLSDNVPPRVTDYLTKASVPSNGNPPFESLVRKVEDTPKDRLCFCCLPEFEGETFLLKIPHTTDIDLGETELKLR